jgi:hypothetical protein
MVRFHMEGHKCLNICLILRVLKIIHLNVFVLQVAYSIVTWLV